jgi:hypothetical protein
MTFQTISPGRHHEAALPDLGENHYPGGQQNHSLDKTTIRELPPAGFAENHACHPIA